MMRQLTWALGLLWCSFLLRLHVTRADFQTSSNGIERKIMAWEWMNKRQLDEQLKSNKTRNSLYLVDVCVYKNMCNLFGFFTWNNVQTVNLGAFFFLSLALFTPDFWRSLYCQSILFTNHYEIERKYFENCIFAHTWLERMNFAIECSQMSRMSLFFPFRKTSNVRVEQHTNYAIISIFKGN